MSCVCQQAVREERFKHIVSKISDTAVPSRACERGTCVQEALALENGEVEAWVIRASGRKLLEARIDQLRGRVAVTRIPQRTFTADQWRQLTAQLGAWKVQALHLCLPQ